MHDSAVRYMVNLHEHHDMDLSSAYASAIAEFRSLGAELQVARSVALAEAEHLGMEFGPSQVDSDHLCQGTKGPPHLLGHHRTGPHRGDRAQAVEGRRRA